MAYCIRFMIVVASRSLRLVMVPLMLMLLVAMMVLLLLLLLLILPPPPEVLSLPQSAAKSKPMSKQQKHAYPDAARASVPFIRRVWYTGLTFESTVRLGQVGPRLGT